VLIYGVAPVSVQSGGRLSSSCGSSWPPSEEAEELGRDHRGRGGQRRRS